MVLVKDKTPGTDVIVCSQTTLPCFTKPEFSVVRLHEEFIWLHHSLQENERYSGFIVSGIKLPWLCVASQSPMQSKLIR